MARSNKYTSLNFNDIYQKQQISSSTTSSNTNTNRLFSSSPSSKSPSSSSYLSASRLTHGGMLVLSRPSPKPQPQPQQPPPPPIVATPTPTPPPEDSISLRPQGKTGCGVGGGTNLSSSSSSSPSPSPVVEKVMATLANSTPKSDKFVPPHLRVGFVAKEVNNPPPPARSGNFRPGSYHGSPDNHRPNSGHGYYGSPNNGRLKSGGGYQYHGSPDNFRPGSGHGLYQENGRPGSGGGYLDWPQSGGSRPNSSGCCWPDWPIDFNYWKLGLWRILFLTVRLCLEMLIFVLVTFLNLQFRERKMEDYQPYGLFLVFYAFYKIALSVAVSIMAAKVLLNVVI